MILNHETLIEEIEGNIKPGIVNYVKNAGAKGVILGISGGIDSAVVAALCAEALGDFWVKGIYMPCCSDMDKGYSVEEKQDAKDAQDLACWLRIEMDVIDLTTPFVVLKNAINRTLIHQNGGQTKISRAAESNIKSRLRMVTLYGAKEDLNYLCVGTSNKTELYTGYFTKFGDGGVDFEPIGEYYKTEVKILAEILGIKDNVPNICNKAPSARLFPGQTDEGELGGSYELIDSIIEDLEKEREIKPEYLDLAKSLQKRNMTSLHKIHPIPSIPRS